MYKKALFFAWGVLFLVLFLYSFTQIDLSLTFSRVSVWQGIEKSFQYIGYFNRPLSTYLYLGILLFFSILYCILLRLVNQKKLSRKSVWLLILFGTGILVFSYNAFSYDLFNYIFDAKILTHYYQNPYTHTALDFPTDPMLSFMHWTHRTYPYGPLWLVLTAPLSFIGANIFIITFYLFKILMAGSFLLSSLLVEKITSKTNSADPLFALVFFALNPLVVIESLVSGHNDIVMMALALLGVYLLVENKYILSPLSIAASVAVKFATAFMVPFYAIAVWYQLKKKKTPWGMLFMLTALIMVTAVVLASVRTNFQPWYLLYVLPFSALVAKKYIALIPSIAVSIISLLTYAPFLFLGNWDPPVPSILTDINISMIFVFAVVIAILGLRYIFARFLAEVRENLK